jgi:hypothetical protein
MYLRTCVTEASFAEWALDSQQRIEIPALRLIIALLGQGLSLFKEPQVITLNLRQILSTLGVLTGLEMTVLIPKIV